MGGGTNSLHEVHPARVPRWSFCEGEILKPRLQAALEASSLSWEVSTSIPLSDVNGGMQELREPFPVPLLPQTCVSPLGM